MGDLSPKGSQLIRGYGGEDDLAKETEKEQPGKSAEKYKNVVEVRKDCVLWKIDCVKMRLFDQVNEDHRFGLVEVIGNLDKSYFSRLVV